ncbi:MAG: DapH/DapD/GlmU-related protein [Prevotella sp.]|jgi:serine O-acetyltransferase|nr:serine acetyltransferase [Prevotella sp.]MCH4211863.1 serine acetyltransferase [Prevotella sp.]MCH4240991.1 serine acetyltransferase [Prevotella sp.]
MSKIDWTHKLTDTIEALSKPEALKGLFHQQRVGNPLPSSRTLEEIISLLRSILFPGYFGKSHVNFRTIKYQMGVDVERLHNLLSDQILAGLCFMQPIEEGDEECFRNLSIKHDKAEKITAELISKLPEIRKILATDVIAAYNGDPAADSYEEVISCYPVIKALTNYRVAHELLLLNVPLIPRMMTELAHSETGIDIHPSATIGKYFTIDHGTGVVIGATCKIGENVKLYQGVTLGAKSFPLDAKGNPIKGIPRHPVIEDDVIIYANATLLGRITIGKGCTIGANVWVTKDMAPHTKKYRKDKKENLNLDLEFNNGTGI